MDAGDLRKSPQKELQTQTEVQGLSKVAWEVVEPKCQKEGAKEKQGRAGDLLEFQGDSVRWSTERGERVEVWRKHKQQLCTQPSCLEGKTAGASMKKHDVCRQLGFCSRFKRLGRAGVS